MATAMGPMDDALGHLALVLERADENTARFDDKARNGFAVTTPMWIVLLGEVFAQNWSVSDMNGLGSMFALLCAVGLFAASVSFGFALLGRSIVSTRSDRPHLAEPDDEFTWWGRFVGTGWESVPQVWLDEAEKSTRFNAVLRQVRIVANINAAKLFGANTGIRLMLVSAAFGFMAIALG